MNTQLNVTGFPNGGQAAPPAAISAKRLLYWSVRREIWENRSLYIAPLVVSAVVLFGFFISALNLPEKILEISALPPAQQRSRLILPYAFAAFSIITTTMIVGWFYCLDALHGERRDRSILFWKSLPVSDLITVLSKLAIPFVIIPLLAFAIIVATQFTMLMLSTLILLLKGFSAALLWTHLPMMQMLVGLPYALITMVLWHAPIYAWLLLLSAWAQRSTFLWAVLPPLAIYIVDTFVFQASNFATLLKSRVMGSTGQAFSLNTQGGGTVEQGVNAAAMAASPGHLPAIPDLIPDPVKFLGNTGLWVGLAIAVVLIVIVIRLRRNREPL